MKRLFTAIGIGLCLMNGVGAQQIDSTLAIYATNFGQERIYLHYDKIAYTPGETVWFKAYLMEGVFPAEGSKTVYVDWTDEKGIVLYRNVGPMVDGTSNGQFDIPASYTGKFLHVRAYTKWMLNFDSNFLYQKDLHIILPQSTSATNSAKPVITTSLQFFPEGGDLISGVVNKVAFKANDQWGRPAKIKGTVYNKAGDKVDSLRQPHDGMGFIFITPQPGETFVARWKDEKGTAFTTDLPVPRPGLCLQISMGANKRFFQLNTTPGDPGNPTTVHVIGTMSQSEVFNIARVMTSGEAKGIIPTQDLPTGILTITVLDDNWKPLAERITFINNEENRFKPAFEVLHWGLNKRARNDIQITVPDSLISSLSVSVTDVDIESDSTDNIISSLLLTSEIRGLVYKPGYYFRNNSDTITRNLDLVMLTHGWRRFNWEQVAKGKFPTINYKRDTAYMTLSGRVYGATPSQIKEAGEIILLVRQKQLAQGSVVIVPMKADGTFNDPGLILFDTATIYYQFPKAKNLDVSVKFLEERLATFNRNPLAKGLFSNPYFDTLGLSRHAILANQAAQLLKLYEGKVLENVTVKGKTKSAIEILDEKYSSGMFQGGDGYQFDLINDPFARSSLNIFTYLQGKVAGLQVQNANGANPSMTWRGGAPQLFLNETPTDASFISSVQVSDVAYIKVFRPPFMGGSNGANGGIAIYTRRGGDEKQEPGKGLNNSAISGYTELRQFYSPNYSNFSPDNEKKDVRTTLYWNPQVNTVPKNNKVMLSFYNNDISRAFRVVIEGMTKDGKLARVEEIME